MWYLLPEIRKIENPYTVYLGGKESKIRIARINNKPIFYLKFYTDLTERASLCPKKYFLGKNDINIANSGITANVF